MSARDFHFKASEYHAEARKRRVQTTAKIVVFLNEHPLSTSKEIFDATGASISSAWGKFFRRIRYHGRLCYRVNHAALLAHGDNERCA